MLFVGLFEPIDGQVVVASIEIVEGDVYNEYIARGLT